MKKSALYIIIGIAAAMLACYFLRMGSDGLLLWFHYHAHQWRLFAEQHAIRATLLFIGLSMLSIAVGLPAVMPLSLLGGMLFGITKGISYTLVGIMLGSGCIFLLFRYLFVELVKKRYAKVLYRMNERMTDMGTSYLLILYFSLVVPLVLINAVAALSSISFPLFLLFAGLGSLPLVVVFAIAGNKLGVITSLNDVFSREIILIFLFFAGIAGVFFIATWFYKKHNKKNTFK